MVDNGENRAKGRFDLWLTVLLALAAVGTAWAGFQSAKWGGVQANSYASASAIRTESSRATTEASQFHTIDVIAFTSWLNALNEEIIADPSVRPSGGYTPDPDAVSGFLFQRFRDEFQPAVDAWLATRPLISTDAPATPFSLPEYRLAAEDRAEELAKEADALAETARTANQRSDNYVLTAVVFALVLFFTGLAGRAQRKQSRRLLFSLAVVALLGSIITLVLLPVQF